MNLRRRIGGIVAGLFSLLIVIGIATPAFASTAGAPQKPGYSATGAHSDCFGLPNGSQTTRYGQPSQGPPCGYGQNNWQHGSTCNGYGQHDGYGPQPYGQGCRSFCPPGNYREEGPQFTGYDGSGVQTRCPIPVVYKLKPPVSVHYACLCPPKGSSNVAYLNGYCYEVSFVSYSSGYQYGSIVDRMHKEHQVWRIWTKHGWSQWYVIT